jgi:SagB-type dehydrogenase family enzyme
MEERVFELFWENSKLNATTARTFSDRIDSYEMPGGPVGLDYPAPDIPLHRPSDRLLTLMRQRRSRRAWSDRPVTRRQLSSLLAGLAWSPHGTRLYPSAGATYAVESYVLCHRVEGLCGACHYNPDNHSLSELGPPLATVDYVRLLNLEFEQEPPAVTVVLTAFSERTTDKYGSRGGRFVLLEAGHAAQNLALRAAQEGLAAVAVGGLLDDEVADLLDLRRLGGKVVLGVACGLASTPRRHRRLGIF